MTRYLTVSEVVAINEAEGGEGKLISFALAESAVLRPQSSAGGEDAFTTVHEKAAALYHSLARNHAFVTANKRTAWTAVVVFYRLNGYAVEAEQGNAVALTIDVASGFRDVPEIAAALATVVVQMVLPDVETIDLTSDFDND